MDKSTKYIMTQDAFFKRSMSRQEVVTEFFTANLPQRILDVVDLSTLKLEKGDFMDNNLGYGIVDVLYSVKWDKEPGYISLLLEHQSTPDPLMSFRIQKYMLRLCDAHMARYPKLKYPELKLPCIYPMIFYSGKTKYTSPRAFWELFSDPELAKQYFTGPIDLLELRTIKNIELKNQYHSGIILRIMRAIHSEDILPHLYILQPFFYRVAKEYGFHMLEDGLRFLLHNGKSNNKESIIEIFANAVPEQDKGKIMNIANAFIQEGLELGIQQGMQQGMQKERMTVAKNLLASDISLDVISKATSLSLEEIKKLKTMVH